jgi:CheY-like chemotaxis protein
MSRTSMTPMVRAPADLTGLRVLVVEDILLVAEVIQDQLESCGCTVVGPASRVESALQLVESAPLDGALLDVNLAGEFCFPVAAALRQRGVPFIFLTGYDDPGLIPIEFRTALRLSKPFDRTKLTTAIAGHFQREA